MGMKKQLFGTDGIRGRANTPPMTAEMALQLGRALAWHFKRDHPRPRVVIGKDTRRSGYMIENALVAGICSMGGQALLLGPLPTPSVAYHIRGMRAQAGVMISASHNPFYDNGLKVFDENGFKIDDSVEAKIEEMVLKPKSFEKKFPAPEDLGRAKRIDDALGRYLVHLKSIFRTEFDLKGLKIVFDGANGAAYACGPKLFEELGAEVIAVHCEPNGFNINENCAQSDPAILGRVVREQKADLGVGVDGDADRLLLVDEEGHVVSGEHLLYELARFLKDSDRLKSDSIVTTTMANQALENALNAQEIECLRANVGDRYVTELLRSKGAILGGETSGHFIFLDQNTTADGLFSALEVLALLQNRAWRASQLRKAFELFPQKLVSLPVKEKRDLESWDRLQEEIRSVEKSYGAAGRVNVRYSGTEMMIRLMLEGPDRLQIEKDLGRLSELVQKEIGFG